MSSASGVRWRAAVIVAAVALAYANSLSGPFLFDDENSIVNNPTIRSVETALSPPRDTPVAGRPVVNLTFALNYAADGLDATGYHVVNVAIHVAVALLLFGVVRRTFRLKAEATEAPRATAEATGAGGPTRSGGFRLQPEDPALACALVWALHPLNTEAVNYLTERTESVMALFYVLTLYCAIRGSDPATGRHRGQTPVRGDSRLWTAAAVIACALGMLSKESMVTAPVVVLLYDRVFRFGSLREAFRARRALYGGLAATWLILAAVLASEPRTSVGFGAGTTAWGYLLNQAEVVARYLWLTVWPRALVLDYGLPRALTLGDVLVPGALVVALVIATVVALRYRPALGFLGAWMFVTLAPTSSIVPIATEVGAERRMYLPLMAIAVLVVMGTHRLVWGAGLDGRVRGPQGSAPHQEREAGSAPQREKGAGSAPHNEKGAGSAPQVWLAGVGALCLALAAGTVLRNEEYRSRLTMAQTIVERRPHGRGRFLLGTELLAAGQRDAALAQLRLSARDYPGARFALATELLSEGKGADAIPELQAFLAAMPATHQTVPPARDLLGRAYLMQRKFSEAAEQFQVLRQVTPPYRGPRNDIAYNHGYALAAAGRLAEAVPVLEEAVAANPTDAAARDLLARVRAALSLTALTNRRD